MPDQTSLHARENVSVLSGDSLPANDLLAGLKASRREATGPERQMAELEDQYHACLGATSSSGLSFPQQSTLRESQSHKILKSCCRPELARLIPDEMLDALKGWLISKDSVLEPSRRGLIEALSKPREMRKVIHKNPHLARGDLCCMDDVVFANGSRLLTSEEKKDWAIYELGFLGVSYDYSGISFRRACFQDMILEDVSFKNCDMAWADLTGSTLSCCSFYGADLTAARFSKSSILFCDFHKATLINVYFDGTEKIKYYADKNYSKTVDSLSQALAECGLNDDQAVLILRMRARILAENKKQKELETVCDELMRRNRMDIEGFYLLGNSYMESTNRVDDNDNDKDKDKDKDKEIKTFLAEKAIACFQKGWRLTDNNIGKWTHNSLFDSALLAIRRTGPAFNWYSVLEEIKSTGTKNSFTLILMAQTLMEKYEDQEAMDILLQQVNSPEGDIEHLNMICKVAAQIGLRNKEYLTSALIVLEGATTLAQDISEIENLDMLTKFNIFPGWLYRLDLLTHYGLCEEASHVADEMNQAIPGSWELFSAENYKQTETYRKGASYFREVIEKIRASNDIMSLVFRQRHY